MFAFTSDDAKELNSTIAKSLLIIFLPPFLNILFVRCEHIYISLLFIGCQAQFFVINLELYD